MKKLFNSIAIIIWSVYDFIKRLFIKKKKNLPPIAITLPATNIS